jgi:hypothetical protein
VAQRKELLLRRRARHELADHRAVLFDVAGERRVLARVQHVDARAEHRDGRATARERAPMRGRIHAARQAAHDDETRGGQVDRQPLRH